MIKIEEYNEAVPSYVECKSCGRSNREIKIYKIKVGIGDCSVSQSFHLCLDCAGSLGNRLFIISSEEKFKGQYKKLGDDIHKISGETIK